MDFAPSASWNSRSITHLANYPSRSLPMISSNESKKKAIIFAQGDASDGLFFIQHGKVRLSVKSEGGKKATLLILGEEDFFGEGGFAGQLVRTSSATAITDCVLLHIERKAMMQAMSQQPKLSATFVNCLLKRVIRYQDDLVDQLSNVSEKRLARVLLLMAHSGKKGVVDIPVSGLSQGTLAEMVGTTRSRVSFFMNRFRKLGFINYDARDNLSVHSSLLSVVQKDDIATMTPADDKPTPHAENVLALSAGSPNGPRD